ncbi:HAD-IIA family hydrolase [Falsirhodobacter deserti]|uniref:HAD-IIA family hydrolase n=1 Tax=Falsirhodobacter deserti TaxID=1365611 RepID=UPI0013E2BBD6|nr:HAD-IA family hydrolase [Falsirhodobacter deserti]
MTPDRNEECRALVTKARRILCDIDGCLIRGDSPIDGAAAFVRSVADKLVLVSNNSTDTAATLSLRLSRIGLPVPESRLFLAGEQTLLHLKATLGRPRIMLIATDTIRSRAAQLGFDLTPDRPDLVVLCRAPHARVMEIEAALGQIIRGVPAVAANPDVTHPGPTGPAIETGALVHMLGACHPGLSMPIIGKPEPSLFHRALQGIGIEHAVMIGDNSETDIAGARRLGMSSILVHPDRRFGRTIADLVVPSDEERRFQQTVV